VSPAAREETVVSASERFPTPSGPGPPEAPFASGDSSSPPSGEAIQSEPDSPEDEESEHEVQRGDGARVHEPRGVTGTDAGDQAEPSTQTANDIRSLVSEMGSMRKR
jgi:hypothetical protein